MWLRVDRTDREKEREKIVFMNTEQHTYPPLSRRLKTAAGMVTPGFTAADIGCDHGYVAIYLRLAEISPACICSDINKGPLEAAAENIKKYQADRIKLICADGLSGISPGEADSIIITGMGGELICRILKKGCHTVWAAKELILGPQSEPEKVRRLIAGIDLIITDEALVSEDGKYYPIMKVQQNPAASGQAEFLPEEDETELLYGPVLLKNHDPVLKQFLEKEMRSLENALRNLEAYAKNSRRTLEQKQALEHRMELNKKAQEYFTWNTETRG